MTRATSKSKSHHHEQAQSIRRIGSTAGQTCLSAGIQVPPRVVLQPQGAVSVRRRMRRSAFVSHHHAARLRVGGSSSNTIQTFHQRGVISPDKNGRVPVFVLT